MDVVSDQAVAAAARFAARKPAMLGLYRTELLTINNPLAASAATWAQCELQAERIIDGCTSSLRDRQVNIPDRHIRSVYDLGAQRVSQGVHVSHSVRAGMILFEILLNALLEETSRESMDVHLLGPALQALQTGIGMRLEAGMIGYDALLLANTREVHGESYRRLARDIHDHIGNGLSLALRQIELLELAESAQSPEQARRVAAAKSAMLETMAGISSLITQLRQPVNVKSLETALKAYVTSMAVPLTSTSVHVAGSEDSGDDSVLDEVFILVRECLRNAFTHARATAISVSITITGKTVEATVSDDGAGFDVDAMLASSRINGLTGMAERVELLGGEFSLQSAVGSGTTVYLSVPAQERRR
jgi:signal transduction histidine kinase